MNAGPNRRPLRVAIYARTAAMDFTEADETIARLRALLEARVPADRAVEVTPYPEVGESGLGGPGPVLERLLEDAFGARYHVVIVADLRALHMVPRRQADIVADLASVGAQVIPQEFLAAWPVQRDGAGAEATR